MSSSVHNASDGLLASVLDATEASRAQRTTRLEAFLAESSSERALAVWLGLARGDRVPSVDAIRSRLTLDLATLDRWLSGQLDAILHAPEFQALESSWRGLRYLVRRSEGAEDVKIRVLNCAWNTLARDLDKAIEFDQSAFFHKIYSDEFGTPGGEPFGALLIDTYVAHRIRPGHKVDDVRALRGVAMVAAAAFCPTFVGVHASLFGVDTISEIERVRDFESSFRADEFVGWNALRDLEDSRFLGAVAPRCLARKPWRPTPSRRDGFRYREDVSSPDGQSYLWMNGCFALGGVLIRSFDESGWFGGIRGVETGRLSGGLVEDLLELEFEGAGAVRSRLGLETVISDETERELSELGLISLAACKGTPFAAFYAVPSLRRPEVYESSEATTNARLSVMLQHILCTGRIAHYLKMMCRDRSGSYTTAEDLERDIQEWLFALTVSSEDADLETLAKYPLADGSISVDEVPGKPGTYSSVVHLRPHFQLDQMTSSIRLMTEMVTN